MHQALKLLILLNFVSFFPFILPYHGPTKTTKKKDNNLGLPPKPPSLEELADEQKPLAMVAGQVIVAVLTLLNKSPATDEVPAAPVQAGASTELFVPNLRVLTADEVFAARVHAGASTNLPASIADEVPTPVQA
jgi:hypothetical protein